MTRDRIPLERLREMFVYSPETGDFIRRIRAGKCLPGSIAGYVSSNRYVRIEIDHILYHAHRLAWFYMTGNWPDQIDHINGDPSCNIFSNLRDVTRSINMENRKRATKKNKLGVLGVKAHGSGFMAKIKVCGQQMYLGTFPTAELAHAAYLVAKRKWHEGCTI